VHAVPYTKGKGVAVKVLTKMNDLFTGKTNQETAIERIKTFCPPEGYHVAFSGGKDSVVVLDLVKKSGVKFDAHYYLTSVDPPELVKFVKTFADVTIEKPKMTMWKLIPQKRMPPTRKVAYCCEFLKEHNGADRIVLTGIRWEESKRRSKRSYVEPCLKGHKHYLHPIIDWLSTDIWSYIKDNKLAYCSLYNEGYKRIGCVGCPKAGSRQMLKEFSRWPTYKKAYLRSFDICIKKRIIDGLETKWTTGQQMFDWWLKENRKILDPDQTVMFE
jgi:phosphoadenosine phosphosulfate reductase